MSTVETIDVSRHESKSLFDAGFWLDCEREAAQVLRTMTGADDDPLTTPDGVAAS